MSTQSNLTSGGGSVFHNNLDHGISKCKSVHFTVQLLNVCVKLTIRTHSSTSAGNADITTLNTVTFFVMLVGCDNMKNLYFRYASSKESQCYEAVSLCHLLSQAQKLKKHFSKSENSDTGGNFT